MIGIRKRTAKKTQQIKVYFQEWYEVHGMGVWDREKLSELDMIILAIEFEMYCISRGFKPIWDG